MIIRPQSESNMQMKSATLTEGW